MKNRIYHIQKETTKLKNSSSKTNHFTLIGSITLCIALTITSCNKFVDVSPPINKITSQELFKDDANATSSVLGIYSLISSFYVGIMNGALTAYGGLAADELAYTSYDATVKEFQNNSISSTNSSNQVGIWTHAYKLIYQINACIEGITSSNGISTNTKKQLVGECKVVRAMIYFYLIQLYGAVPLITTTDFNITSVQGRTAAKDVYGLILSDLIDAKSLLTASYPTAGRIRPNLYTAEAILARVYLFQGNWTMAETESTNIINNPQYSLQPDLNKVFLVGSSEAIWQITSVVDGMNTREGSTFINTNLSAIPSYLISDQLLTAFEPGDPRKNAWIAPRTVAGRTYYFPYKYKVPFGTSGTAITENYMMLRLAEQHLIRAEAKIRQGKIDEGINDLNTLRKRARGSNNNILTNLPTGVSSDIALSFVLKERRIELMTEWGHRWFDLKRLQLSNAILSPIKPSWKDTDTLFPIPANEIIINGNLTQNNGYN